MTDYCPECWVPLRADGTCGNKDCAAYQEAASGSPSAAAAPPPAAGLVVAPAPSNRDQLERLKALYTRRQSGEVDYEFVTICGFPTAGKTWLTPRIEDDLINRRAWSTDMDDRESPGSSMETLTGTKSMGQTQDLLIHSFAPANGQRGRAIKLIDVPGESMRRMMDSSDDAGLPAELLAALVVSDRIILTLPSDVCVIGTLIQADIAADPDVPARKARALEIEKRDEVGLETQRNELADALRQMRRQNEANTAQYSEKWQLFTEVSVALSEKRLIDQWTRLATFAKKIKRVMGRTAYIADTIGRDKFFDLPPERWLDGYSQQHDERPVPITRGSYAVLTKADRVLPLINDTDHCPEWDFLPERAANRDAMEQSGWRDALAPYLGDPRLLLSMIMPTLVSQLDGWLPNMRYDWASADWQGGDWSIELDETHPHRGIEPLTDWLCDGAPAITASPRAIASVSKLRLMIEGRHGGQRKSK